MVSLSTPENRAIVYLGAQSIMNPTLKNRIGFQELLNVAGVKEYVSSSDMGFKLAPQLTLQDEWQIRIWFIVCFQPPVWSKRKLASELNDLNKQRQDVQQEMVDSIIDKIPDELPNFLVISGTREEGFHKRGRWNCCSSLERQVSSSCRGCILP